MCAPDVTSALFMLLLALQVPSWVAGSRLPLAVLLEPNDEQLHLKQLDLSEQQVAQLLEANKQRLAQNVQALQAQKQMVALSLAKHVGQTPAIGAITTRPQSQASDTAVQVSEAGPPFGTLESQVSHYDQQVAQLLHANDRLLGQNNDLLLANAELLALLTNLTGAGGRKTVPQSGQSPAPSPWPHDNKTMDNITRIVVPVVESPWTPPGMPWNPVQNAYVRTFYYYRNMCDVNDTDLATMAASEPCKNSIEQYTGALTSQFNALAVVNSLFVSAATGLFGVAAGFETSDVAWQWLANIVVTAWTFVILLSCIAVLVCTSFLQITTEYPPTWEFMKV